MKTRLLASAAALAVLAGTAHAQDLKFAPGEDARFNWDSFKAFDEATNLDGQTLSNLEVLKGPDGTDKGSLFEFVNKAVTSFGKRRLHDWLVWPLFAIADITARKVKYWNTRKKPHSGNCVSSLCPL
mgnify:CR=1 FL=1